MKDTKYEDLNKTLAAVGKAVFVNFYYDFKDFSIPSDELAKKIYSRNPGSKSDSQNFRIPRARHIFELGQEKEALRIIIKSKRVDPKAIEKAKDILDKETISEGFQKESVEERRFIEHFNKEIQYDITLREAPLIAERTQYIYPRKQYESKNALRRAQYLCEVDNSHFVFKRRNSPNNYTEPHHLIPLSAYRDFPGIDLDREQNIVSLCSNCHNLLHYGSAYKDVLHDLYQQRKELLEEIGITISFEQLLSYY
ncbi:HNH endonuclease [Clostridium sp. KNHs205]|uniref:HNH endonuclease n=1 Tax=Clostridium sp. KNHs205 TaxID=1449050 RepID=UPI00051B4DA7